MRLHKVDSSRLLAGDMHFNPSVCDYLGKKLMAYRLEDRAAHSWSQIAICELDEDWQPVFDSNKLIDLPEPFPGTNLFEDPRLYVFSDQLVLTFIAARFNGHQHVASQGICELDDSYEIVADSILYPDLGSNLNYASMGDPMRLKSEKNWTLFRFENSSEKIIYTVNPLDIESERGRSRSKAQINWQYGFLSGSTPLVPWEGNLLLGCFHSFVYEGVHRKYYVGWYVLDPAVGRIVSYSKSPFLEGKIDGDEKRPTGSSWVPRAVFPCGLMDLGEEMALSYGWLDSTCRIGFFAHQEIRKSLIPVTKWFEEKEVLINPWGGIPGGFVFKAGDSEVNTRSWPTAVRKAQKEGISENDLMRLICPKVDSRYKKIDWVEA